MSTRVIETITCDRCGRAFDNGHPDVRFTWQGEQLVVDLCDEHFEWACSTMRALLAVAVPVARREREVERVRRLHGLGTSGAPRRNRRGKQS